MGNLSGESREQIRKDKVTRFRSVTYARQLGLTGVLGLFLGLVETIWCHYFFNLHFIILLSLHPYATQNNFRFSLLLYSYLTVIEAGLLAFSFT